MNRVNYTMKKAIFFAVIFLFFATTIFAYVASSSNYILQFDSVNMGGDLSTSTNYELQDTQGEIASGESNSTSYYMHAGYQNLNEQYIAVSAGTDLSFSTLTTSTNTTISSSKTITVNTDNPAGYLMYIKASADPALNCFSGSCTPGVDYFANYTPVGANPDFTWSSGASDAEFGYSIEGSDTSSFFKDDGADCNTGSGNVADKCWYSLGTTDRLIASSQNPNHSSGSQTTIKFFGQIGASKTLTNGLYSATITLTVVSQ